MSAPTEAAGPPPAPSPEPTPERPCPRCGHALRPDQDWCLACGAAVTTRIAEPRGWRVPYFVGGGLLALAIVAVVLALIALSRGSDQVAEVAATPTPTPAGSPFPGATASPTPSPGATASPGASAVPTVPPATAGGNGTTPRATPSPGATPGAGSGSASEAAIPDWPTGRSAWTIVLESAKSRAQAEKVAKSLKAQGDSVGILRSDEHSSLNKGYWVVFSGQYDSKKAAEAASSSLPAERAGAYVRRVSAT